MQTTELASRRQLIRRNFATKPSRPGLRERADDAGGAQLLTIAAVAAMLGVHRSTIYRMLERGQLPIDRFPVGNEIRLSRRQIERWLDGSTQPPSAGATPQPTTTTTWATSWEERRRRTIAASPSARRRSA